MFKARLLVLTTAATVSLTTWLVTPGEAAATRPVETRTASAAVTAAAKAAPVDWGRCRARWMRQARVRCGYVSVPLDYSDPSAGSIRIAVSRVRHTTRRSKGVMLANPGGPGGSGLAMSILGQLMPRNSGAGYDWIGFDPRGVGASRPRLSCRPRYFHANRPPYVANTQPILDSWLTRSESYAKSCDRKRGRLLDHMKTIDTVRDMEEIRKALGVRRISFYGYSYGTYLGQVYATAFPSRIHRMVLDSNVDPRQIWYSGGASQTRALQRVFDHFFGWIARHHRVYRLGRTGPAVERRYLRERQALRDSPARGVLGPSEYDDAFLPAAYLQLAWPLLADSFVALARRDNPGPLIRIWRLVDAPGNDNQYAVFNAVTCTDAPWPDISTVIDDARRLHRVAPVVAWASTWSSGPCAFWPAETGTPVTVRDTGVRPLLVGQTLDGATPFSASLGVRSIFRGSRLIAIQGGTTHGSTPDLSGPCVNVRLAAYLKTGALPPRKPGRRADVNCPAPPPPQPAAAAGRGAIRSALGVRLLH